MGTARLEGVRKMDVDHPTRTFFETFEHGADIGVRGRGATRERAFANAAKALFSLMVIDLEKVRPVQQIEVSCSSYDQETLLVAWLNILLAEADIHRMLFSDFYLHIENLEVHGIARGEVFDSKRHERGVEVKGATYTELAVRKEEDVWIAQCVVDV